MNKMHERYNRFNKQIEETKVRIFCRLSYANIWTPKSILGSDPKYSVSCLIDKEDTKTLELVEKAIEAARQKGISTCWGGKMPAGRGFKEPLHDGDEERPGDVAYMGHKYINATSSDAPEIVGKDPGVKITDPMEVGSGDYAMVTINFYPFNADGASKGISAGLQNIQLAAHGPRLTNKSTAADDFENLPEFDDEKEGNDVIPDFL